MSRNKNVDSWISEHDPALRQIAEALRGIILGAGGQRTAGYLAAGSGDVLSGNDHFQVVVLGYGIVVARKSC